MTAGRAVSAGFTASVAVLRIVNNSSYDIVDARLNGVQQIFYPSAILSGSSHDFTFNSSGTVTIHLGNGSWASSTSRDIWFTFDGTRTVTLGATTTLQFDNPTIGQLMSGFTSAKNWDGVYFDANINSWFARFRFTSSGGWTFYDSTAPCLGGSTCTFQTVGSGTLRLVSWPRYSTIVTFDLGPGSQQAQVAFPFSSFFYRNGPPSWPIIEYIEQ
jgi:hypothetical protein